MEMKICTKCGIDKPLTEFFKVSRGNGVRPSRGGKGVRARCKHCTAEAASPGVHDRRNERNKQLAAGNRLCGGCNEWRPAGEFHKRAASFDGVGYTCIACANEKTKKWREDNPSAFKNWYGENKTKRAEYWQYWYAENKDAARETHKLWARANKHIVNALIARRRAAKARATPSWADHDVIRAFYVEAARLTEETGVQYEVDHFYPILGKLVCGLHCETNLQIISKSENSSKNNRMPEDYYETNRD